MFFFARSLREPVGSLGQASLFQSASVRGTSPMLAVVLMLACLFRQTTGWGWTPSFQVGYWEKACVKCGFPRVTPYCIAPTVST